MNALQFSEKQFVALQKENTELKVNGNYLMLGDVIEGKCIEEINDQLQADYIEEQETNNERISEKPKQKKNKGFEDLDEDIPF